MLMAGTTGTKGLEQFRLPRWEELPSMSSIWIRFSLSFEEWLGEYLSFDGKKIMTKTMVNNYVKQKFISPPINKKYDRTAVASLFVIAVLKPVYTINEISRLIHLAVRSSRPERAYNQFCRLVEEAVSHAFEGTTMPKNYNPDDPRGILWNVCNAFACQLYVRNIYLQAQGKDDTLKAAANGK